MTFYVQAFLDGIMLGGVYALAAMGVSLIFGVMRVSNFAHGSLIALGMYLTYQIWSMWGGLPYYYIPIIAIVLFVIGYAIEKYFIFPVAKSNEQNQLMMAMAFSILLENVILMIWGGNYYTVEVKSFRRALLMGPFAFTKSRIISFACVAVVAVFLYYLLYKTDVGKAIRACSDNKEGAAICGVNIKLAFPAAFGIGAACAGICGCLLTPTMYFYPAVGGTLVLKCFVIAVLGGLGSIWGSMVGGLIIGVVQAIASFQWGGTWADMVVYMIFILVLVIKPSGLFGKGGKK